MAKQKVDGVTGDQADKLRAAMGARVRLARRALDLTQGELAALFGRTHGWLGPIEAGKVFAPPDLIATLRAATGQPFGWFFGEDDDARILTRQEVGHNPILSAAPGDAEATGGPFVTLETAAGLTGAPRFELWEAWRDEKLPGTKRGNADEDLLIPVRVLRAWVEHRRSKRDKPAE